MLRTFKYRADNPIIVREILKNNGFSTHILTGLKHTEGSICIDNDIPVFLNHVLLPTETLTVYLNEKESSPNIVPVNIPLEIVYEDEDILLINKPSDMPIHPSINNHDNTLANGVMHYYTSQNQKYVFRCINRLDRDTSGLTLLAKNALSGAILSDMKLKDMIHKEYYAICSGLIPDNGTINAGIARREGSTIERTVDMENGEHAVTHYERLCYRNDSIDSDSYISLAKITLETGRTHQIRVHFRHLGYPLIGDFLYNPDYRHIGRQALHCGVMEFPHPVTNKNIRVKAPMPYDMSRLFPEYSI